MDILPKYSSRVHSFFIVVSGEKPKIELPVVEVPNKKQHGTKMKITIIITLMFAGLVKAYIRIL